MHGTQLGQNHGALWFLILPITDSSIIVISEEESKSGIGFIALPKIEKWKRENGKWNNVLMYLKSY